MLFADLLFLHLVTFLMFFYSCSSRDAELWLRLGYHFIFYKHAHKKQSRDTVTF